MDSSSTTTPFQDSSSTTTPFQDSSSTTTPFQDSTTPSQNIVVPPLISSIASTPTTPQLSTTTPQASTTPFCQGLNMETASLQDKLLCGLVPPLTTTQISVLNSLDALNGLLSLSEYTSTPEYTMLKTNIQNIIGGSIADILAQVDTGTPLYGGGKRRARHSVRRVRGKKQIHTRRQRKV